MIECVLWQLAVQPVGWKVERETLKSFIPDFIVCLFLEAIQGFFSIVTTTSRDVR